MHFIHPPPSPWARAGLALRLETTFQGKRARKHDSERKVWILTKSQGR